MTTPLDIHVDLLLSTGRESVTGQSDVLASEPITITRGRPAESSQSAPTRVSMTLDNTDGRYSPRNPASDLYGLIGRNTQAQVYLGTPHLGAAGGSGTASTSHVAPSVTATTDGILICGWMSDDVLSYTVPGSMTGGPSETDGTYSTQRTAYQVVSAGATGTRTATGSVSTGYSSVSAVVHGASAAVEEMLSGSSATLLDVTLTTDAATQAGWWMVAVQGWLRGYDSPMPDAPYGDGGGWILLGDSGRITGTNSTGADQTVYLRQRIWARRVNWTGAQTVIFGGVAGGAAADNHAALYVLSGVDDWDIRATVEIPSWPSRWDISGNHVWVPVDGSGILRRLQQGSTLHSPMRRAITGAAATLHVGRSLLPVAYWPLEDGTGSTVAASGLPGGTPLTPDGTIQWASVEVTGSAPGPDWSAAAGNLAGPIVGVTTSQGWGIGCLVQYTGATSWDALRVTVQGGKYSDLRLNLGTSATLSATAGGSTSTLTSAISTLNDGDPHWIEVWCVTPIGTPLQHVLRIDGAVEGVVGETGERGVPVSMRVQRRGADTAGLLHLGVWAVDAPADPVSSIYSRLLAPAITAHAGEAAGRRIERLCREEGVAIHIVGDPDDTTPMGEQPIGSLLTLLREAEEADLGILYEPRVFGLAYRTRASRYNQPATLELVYGDAAEVSHPLEPVDDDRYTHNDVTVTRSGGSSYRYEVDDGPLSTQPPPDGVGRYAHAVTVNVHHDGLLLDQASARAHLGTWDELRYPTVHVNLAALIDVGKDSYARAAAALDPGDRLTIERPPAWLPPDAIDQHVEGVSAETLGTFVRTLALVCVPAGPYTVGIVEDEVLGRADTDGMELAADFDAGTDTSMSVTVTAGPAPILTSTHASMFDFDIQCGGAVLTVTGISGSGPYTFTVLQDPVNGVVRTIPAGTSLSLAHPWRAAP